MANREGTGVDPEDQDATVDDDFRALLEGLRTTLPGIQIVTAFLLIVPFQAAFDALSTAERWAYYVSFGSALLASVLLMAPSSHQRLRAVSDGTVARRSGRHLAVAIRLTIVGSALYALALSAVAYLVASILLATPVAIVLTAVIVVVCTWSWFYLPLVRFGRGR